MIIILVNNTEDQPPVVLEGQVLRRQEQDTTGDSILDVDVPRSKLEC